MLIASLACSAVQAAFDPLSVSVGGRIAPVNSCMPTLSNGDLDYGAIPSSELNRDRATFLPEKTFTLTVNCQDKVNRLSIRFVDRRADDAVRDTSVIRHPLCTHARCGSVAFGLGKDTQARKIGAFFLVDKGAAIDGQPVNWWSHSTLQPSSPGTRFWHNLFTPYRDDRFSTEYSPSSLSCESHASHEPARYKCFAGQHFSMPIGLTPAIDSRDRTFTGDVSINGALTIEMHTL